MMNVIYCAILIWMAGLYAVNRMPRIRTVRQFGKPCPMYKVNSKTGSAELDPEWESIIMDQYINGHLPPTYDIAARMTEYRMIQCGIELHEVDDAPAYPHIPARKKPSSSRIKTM